MAYAGWEFAHYFSLFFLMGFMLAVYLLSTIVFLMDEK